MKEVQDILKKSIKEYEFQSLFDDSNETKGFRNFEFNELNGEQIQHPERHQRAIKFERENAQDKSFEISPIVREHRGINRQEKLEREQRIQEEVERQVQRIQEEAYKAGFEKGIQDGQEEVFQQTRAGVEEKLVALNELIQETLALKSDLIQNQKQEIYRTIRNLTKWVILRELKDDGDYVLRLLDKLLEELQAKSNILVQIDQNSFGEMPDIIEIIQEKLSHMKNVRVEVDYDIEGPGLVIESDNGIINGSLEEQFFNLSRLFESVGLQNDGAEVSETLASGTFSAELENTEDSSQPDSDEEGSGEE